MQIGRKRIFYTKSIKDLVKTLVEGYYKVILSTHCFFEQLAFYSFTLLSSEKAVKLGPTKNCIN